MYKASVFSIDPSRPRHFLAPALDRTAAWTFDSATNPGNQRDYSIFDSALYRITAHPSQRKTVDRVILSADAMKQELFYVGASRGRSETAIVTSDREQPRESLGISSARPSAMELLREYAHSRQPVQGIQQALARQIEPPSPQHEIAIGHDAGLSL